MNLDKEYWSIRYQENQTSWDVGEITTPLKNYFDQLTNKDLKILIPGAGNGYEVEYLFNNGFTNVTVIDLSELPLQNLLTRIPEFPKEKLICGDFFAHTGKYDLIVEQTFFCALDPSMRSDYAKKMQELLECLHYKPILILKNSMPT